jgi:hypothetical protein
VQEIIGKRRDENARESAMRIQQNGIKKDLLHHLMTAETDYGALNEKEVRRIDIVSLIGRAVNRKCS